MGASSTIKLSDATTTSSTPPVSTTGDTRNAPPPETLMAVKPTTTTTTTTTTPTENLTDAKKYQPTYDSNMSILEGYRDFKDTTNSLLDKVSSTTLPTIRTESTVKTDYGQLLTIGAIGLLLFWIIKKS